MPKKIMTKSQFKTRWESNAEGGGITNDDCADCAVAWGIMSHPRTRQLDSVVRAVCEAAGVDYDAE